MRQIWVFALFASCVVVCTRAAVTPTTTALQPSSQSVLGARAPSWVLLISQLQDEPLSLQGRPTTLEKEEKQFVHTLLAHTSRGGTDLTDEVTRLQEGLGMIHKLLVGRLEGVGRRLGKAPVSVFDQLTHALGFHDVPSRAGDHYASALWRDAEREAQQQQQLLREEEGGSGVLVSPGWLGRVVALAVVSEQVAMTLSLSCADVAGMRQHVVQVGKLTRDLAAQAVKLAAHCPLVSASCLHALESNVFFNHLPNFPSSHDTDSDVSSWFAKEVSHALSVVLSSGGVSEDISRLAGALEVDMALNTKDSSRHGFACARSVDTLATHISTLTAIRDVVSTL